MSIHPHGGEELPFFLGRKKKFLRDGKGKDKRRHAQLLSFFPDPLYQGLMPPMQAVELAQGEYGRTLPSDILWLCDYAHAFHL